MKLKTNAHITSRCDVHFLGEGVTQSPYTVYVFSVKLIKIGWTEQKTKALFSIKKNHGGEGGALQDTLVNHALLAWC